MLRVDDVSLEVDGKFLLQGISADFLPGRLSVLLGPNGAGKSTLLRLLAAELPPSKGRLRLDAKDLQTWSAADLARRRAFLPQSYRLDFAFRALDVVMLGRYPFHGGTETAEDVDRVLQALSRVDAVHLAEREYLSLSGGERQRVQLARVLVQVEQAEGGWLLLDEPTSALDLAHQHQLMRLLREMAARGLGIIASLHDLNLAAAYADEVVMLCEGRLHGKGTSEAVLTAGHIGEIYGLPVEVISHPHSGKPLVLPW